MDVGRWASEGWVARGEEWVQGCEDASQLSGEERCVCRDGWGRLEGASTGTFALILIPQSLLVGHFACLAKLQPSTAQW
ncbi:hypothetical protein NDU88_001208 [Pleurodeles waltl]|uniref:Uncharacterized protein n=1 Tax=Pleurodeles waltl TaxID=8319 RepID=A0AAV7LBX7_PLEWA|nr:hypothetical protein NDU88_001208 [Pleurodeles waltl]